MTRKVPNINTHVFRQPGLPWSESEYSINASEVLALMSGLTTKEEIAIAACVDGHVTDGNWDLIKEIQFGGLILEANKLIGWKGLANGTNNGATAIDRGFSFNGSSHYIATGIIPNGANGFSQDNMTIGAAVITNDDTGTACILGSRDASLDGCRLRQLPSSNRLQTFVNNSGNGNFVADSTFDVNTLYCGDRQDSSTVTMKKNGASFGSASVASVAFSDAEIYLGAYNNNGVADEHFNGSLGYWFIAEAVGFDHSAFYNRMSQLYSDLIAMVVLMAGQSNMDGNENTSNLEVAYQGPQTGVKIFNKTTDTSADDGVWESLQEGVNNSSNTAPANKYGMQMYIGKDLRDYYNEDIYLINGAKGGTAIGSWINSGPSWDIMEYYYEQGVAALLSEGFRVELLAVCWFQGYSDMSSESLANAYGGKLDTLMDNFHSLVGAGIEIIVQVSPSFPDYDAEPEATYRTTVQTAQGALAKANTSVISADASATYVDAGIHIDGATIKRMSDAYKLLITGE